MKFGEWLTFKQVLLIAVAIFFAAATYFHHELRTLYALYQYSRTFKPDQIAENFRSLQKIYPSIKFDRAAAPELFPAPAIPSAVLPESFSYQGTTWPTAQEIQRQQLTSLLVFHEGRLVLEQYHQGHRPDTPVIIFSLTKSLMGMLAGIALEQGHLRRLSDPVDAYAPELKGTVYEGVTVQNVLNMSSGVRWSEDYTDTHSEMVESVVASLTGSLNAYAGKMTRARDQGIFNQYTSMDTQVLGMVIAGATGQRLEDYFRTQLWHKIHPQDDAYLLTDKTGFPVAYGGLIMTTRDLAKFGLLMWRNGQNARGEAVISPAWVRDSTTPDQPHLMPGRRANADAVEGYKNQWWFPSERTGGDFTGLGIYGQTLYVNPALGVVIASNAAYANYPNDADGDTRRIKMMQAIAAHVAAQASAPTTR